MDLGLVVFSCKQSMECHQFSLPIDCSIWIYMSNERNGNAIDRFVVTSPFFTIIHRSYDQIFSILTSSAALAESSTVEDAWKRRECFIFTEMESGENKDSLMQRPNAETTPRVLAKRFHTALDVDVRPMALMKPCCLYDSFLRLCRWSVLSTDEDGQNLEGRERGCRDAGNT